MRSSGSKPPLSPSFIMQPDNRKEDNHMIENPSDNTTGITQVLTEQAPQSSADTSNEIISDGELEAGPVNFSVDSSLEFRQSLEKSGNRYHIQKLRQADSGGFSLPGTGFSGAPPSSNRCGKSCSPSRIP